MGFTEWMNELTDSWHYSYHGVVVDTGEKCARITSKFGLFDDRVTRNYTLPEVERLLRGDKVARKSQEHLERAVRDLMN